MREREIERRLSRGAYQIDAFDEYDDLDTPSEVRMNRRTTRNDRVESHARGRLTEEARERLVAERKDAVDVRPDEPEPGTTWSSWGDAEAHGPEPYPEWVLTQHAAVDRELGVLKTGKEAEVHLMERSLPETGQATLLAAKRYRGAAHRLFHRDAGYLEGRRVRATREMRAMERRSAFGRNLIAQRWAIAEFDALSRLWTAGAPVPYPVQRVGTELLVEFIGDEDGAPAPRLAEIRPDPDQLADLWDQVTRALATLGGIGLTHGDLSAFNVLVHQGELILIDLPQVIDIVVNPQGGEFLRRDVENLAGWFHSHGASPEIADPEPLIELVSELAGLR